MSKGIHKYLFVTLPILVLCMVGGSAFGHDTSTKEKVHHSFVYIGANDKTQKGPLLMFTAGSHEAAPGMYPENAVARGPRYGHMNVQFMPLSGCPYDKQYICFQSDYYAFAYPKNRKPGQVYWDAGEGNYKLLEEEITIRRLGMTIKGLMRIETSLASTEPSDLRGRTYETLYSPEAGIVAITMKQTDGGIVPTFWLVGDIGLGAKRKKRTGVPLTDQWHVADPGPPCPPRGNTCKW